MQAFPFEASKKPRRVRVRGWKTGRGRSFLLASNGNTCNAACIAKHIGPTACLTINQVSRNKLVYYCILVEGGEMQITIGIEAKRENWGRATGQSNVAYKRLKPQQKLTKFLGFRSHKTVLWPMEQSSILRPSVIVQWPARVCHF